MVSGNYFQVLDVQPAVGRLLDPADDDPGVEPVVLISAHLWKARWNGAPDAVGSTLQMDGRAYTVAGVMPEGFRGTLGPWEQTQYWVPLRQRAVDRSCRQPDFLTAGALTLIGRLRHDVSERHAQAALASVRLPYVGLPARSTPSSPLWTPSLHRTGSSRLPFDTFANVAPRRFAGALLALGTVVLLIAVTNVGGMLAARGVSRHGEIATRRALGATHWRVARQLLLESLALAVTGGLMGLLLAQWVLAAITATVPAQFARSVLNPGASQIIALDVPMDWRVLLYTVAICLLAGVGVGLASAWRARRSVGLSALTCAGVGTTAPSTRSLRHWIVAPQICLSVGLLVVAGVLVRSWTAVESQRLGYDPSRLVAIHFDIPSPWRCGPQRQPSPGELTSFLDSRADTWEAILRAASSIPGVRSASLAESLPVEITRAGGTWVSTDSEAGGRQAVAAYISRIAVTSDQFNMLGLQLRQGRFFDHLEERNERRVAVISAGLARALFGERSPLGQRMAFGEPASAGSRPWYEVIGVVDDIATPLDGGRSRHAAYVPLGRGSFVRKLVADTTLTSAQAIRELKLSIARAAPTARISEGTTLQALIDSLLYPQRLSAAVLSASGLLGLLLAAVGAYGVTSYSVAQRTREMGVRLALGAARGDIVRLVLREATRVAIGGCGLGLIFGYIAVRLTSARVVALPSPDAVTLITAPVVLLLAVLLASYLPARRAARIDPIVSLRDL